MDPQDKPRCKNCGDKTKFPSNADPDREFLGWCVPCFQNRPKEDHRGNKIWPSGSGPKRNLYVPKLRKEEM